MLLFFTTLFQPIFKNHNKGNNKNTFFTDEINFNNIYSILFTFVLIYFIYLQNRFITTTYRIYYKPN